MDAPVLKVDRMAIANVAHGHSRLGTRLRGKLADAYEVRGHQTSNLWYVYSPRTDRDWLLKDDLKWAHFLLAESDPHIKDINYSPPAEIVRIGDEGQTTEFDAVVTFKDGLTEWREVLGSDALAKHDIRARYQWEEQVEAALEKGIRYVGEIVFRKQGKKVVT